MLQYGTDTRGDAYNMQSLLPHCMHFSLSNQPTSILFERTIVRKNNAIGISEMIAFTRNCDIPYGND